MLPGTKGLWARKCSQGLVVEPHVVARSLCREFGRLFRRPRWRRQARADRVHLEKPGVCLRCSCQSTGHYVHFGLPETASTISPRDLVMALRSPSLLARNSFIDAPAKSQQRSVPYTHVARPICHLQTLIHSRTACYRSRHARASK